jgi:hypothetical protein
MRQASGAASAVVIVTLALLFFGIAGVAVGLVRRPAF